MPNPSPTPTTPTGRSPLATPSKEPSAKAPSAKPPPPPPSPAVPAVKGRSRRKRIVVDTVLVAGAITFVAVSATTLLGKNASTKFSSIASAICDTRTPSPVSAFDGAAVLDEAPLFAGLGADAVETAQCGGGGGGGGGNFTSSAGNSSSGFPKANQTPAQAPAPSPPTPASSPAPSAAAPAASTSFGVSALDPAVGPGPAAAGHDFISTATLTVRVSGDGAPADVVEAKKREAVSAASSVGGGLFAEQSSFSGDAKAVVTLKVPAERFAAVVDQLSALGALEQRQVKTDEVTQQVIDMDARIAASSQGLDRSRGLLSKATSLSDIASLEADVSRRETELETLRGQQSALAQQVALGTIVLTITTPAPPVAPTTPPTTVVAASAPAHELPGFMDGLNGGWKVFTNVGTVVLAALGAALPFLPLLVVLAIVWRLTRRRARTRPIPM